MRPLIISNDACVAIRKVIAYAEKHVMNMDELLDIYNGDLPPAGDRPEHVCEIPVGYRVVYSIERQNDLDVKHISISVDNPAKLPSVESAREILKAFYIETKLEECKVRIDGKPGEHQCIDILAFN